MGRTRDGEFWNCVEHGDGVLKCKYCHHLFKGKPSISRIKVHLSGEPRQGIGICESKDVPHYVKERAWTANKRCKTMPSSSSNEVSNSSSSQPNDQMKIAPTPFELPEGATAETVQLVEPRGQELLTKELVGQESIRPFEEIFCWLMDDRVSSVGIYGMGGVGKTELAKHLNNKLLKTPNSFNNVYWVTVPSNFSIQNLQKAIASVIDLDLSRVDDEHQRAAKLSKALNNGKKFILFLNDVWDYIPMNKVGIPVDMKGCKWILTTRSLDVCMMMDCQRKIEVNPLSEKDGWLLFLKELGNRSILPKEIESIAKSIATKCEGLPLGIEVMARNMKGVNDILEWRDALHKFEEAIPSWDNMELFEKLKLSYDNLRNPTLQQCFLHSVILPNSVEKGALIDYLIDDEVIQGKNREVKCNRAHTALDRLEKACLLKSVDGREYDEYDDEYDEKRCVKMHGLIRDMAIQIIKNNRGVMLKACAELEEIPDCEEWTEDLVKVSLGCNKIKEIPPGFSPRCPKLSTLLLSHNRLIKISSSFFEQLNGLKVLDLSCTIIEELPSSISYLKNLIVLLLSGCTRLRLVPSLSKLEALKKLDLKGCWSVEMLPQGIEFMSNLRHLDLLCAGIKECPAGILPQLLNLRVLKLFGYLKVEELAFLTKLEILWCKLHNVGDLKTLPSNLNRYTLVVGEINYWEAAEFEQAAYERKLLIVNCSGAEHFLSLSFSSPSLFQSLQYIELYKLKEENTAAALPLSLPHSTFSQLKEFYMHNCRPSMKKLFPLGLVSNFHVLETLEVCDCKEMEEIIATEEERDSNCIIQFALPKLKVFSLKNLPNLKSICKEDIICNSLEYIILLNCEKLNRVAVSLLVTNNDSQFSPLPSLKSIQVFPKEWWEGVELFHPNAKNILSPLCIFADSKEQYPGSR